MDFIWLRIIFFLPCCKVDINTASFSGWWDVSQTLTSFLKFDMIALSNGAVKVYVVHVGFM